MRELVVSIPTTEGIQHHKDDARCTIGPREPTRTRMVKKLELRENAAILNSYAPAV